MYRTQVLPQSVKEKIEIKLKKYTDELTKTNNSDSEVFVSQLEDQIRFMLKEDKSSYIKHLLKHTRKLDKIRGQSFEKVHADLYEDLLNN